MTRDLCGLVDFLNTAHGLKTHTHAFTENMRHKIERYNLLVTEAKRDVDETWPSPGCKLPISSVRPA